MAVGDRGPSLAPVRVVSLSLLFCAAAVLAGLALSWGRMASAQAPDQGYWLPADSAVDGACPPPSGGADYWVPPDSEVGLLPILCPPEGDAMLMGGEWEPTLTFIHPGGEGNEFPVLCALCKPPQYRGEWLWAFGEPYGTGTYHWECDPEETLCEAFYESPVAGMGQTTIASYTWNGETSDPVTSGYIHVFDADLTLAGGSSDQQDTVEDDPGFFMAVGSGRKSLGLNLCPSNPGAVYPEWFDYWWQHDQQPPPPYRTGLSAGGPGGVGIYSGPTGGDLLTGGDLSWGWQEVAPYGEPYEFEEISTPTQLYVQADTPGACTITFGLTYDTYDSCWPPETGASDTVKLTVLGLKLKEVTFSADPDSPVNYFSVAADTDASTYPTPQWKDANGDGNADHPADGDQKYPVCYIRNTKMAATVKVTLGSPEYFTGAVKIRGDGPGNLVFPATDAAVAGGEATTVTPIKCANPFPNCVTCYVAPDTPLAISWQISRDGGASWITVPPQSKNDAFITLDTPQCATPFRTVLYLATERGGTSPETCLTNTWAMFGTGTAPKNVKAWKDDATGYDRPLYYYNGSTNNLTAAQMLADQVHSDGQCGAWADLLLECWKANHIPDLTPVRVNHPSTNSIEGFVVKNVGFGTAHYPADAPWQYIGSDLNFAATGLPGQNTNPPAAKDFSLHYMARHTGIAAYTYYDPSYGTVVSEATLDQARAKWRDNALDFWSRIAGYPEKRYSLLSDLPSDLPVFTNSW